MNRRDQTFRKARKSKPNDDWKPYKTLRNKCNEKIKKAKSNHHKKVLNDNINKPKKFWSKIKNFFPGKSQSMATYQLINVLVWTYLVAFTVNGIKVEKIHLLTYLLTDFTWRYTAKSPPKTTKNFCVRFPYISVLFVRKELKLLSCQKSTDIDNLPSGLLKDW